MLHLHTRRARMSDARQAGKSVVNNTSSWAHLWVILALFRCFGTREGTKDIQIVLHGLQGGLIIVFWRKLLMFLDIRDKTKEFCHKQKKDFSTVKNLLPFKDKGFSFCLRYWGIGIVTGARVFVQKYDSYGHFITKMGLLTSELL